jgi:hypothetical protein
VTARQAKEVALAVSLVAVLLILFMHIDHYIRHLPE